MKTPNDKFATMPHRNKFIEFINEEVVTLLIGLVGGLMKILYNMTQGKKIKWFIASISFCLSVLAAVLASEAVKGTSFESYTSAISGASALFAEDIIKSLRMRINKEIKGDDD